MPRLLGESIYAFQSDLSNPGSTEVYAPPFFVSVVCSSDESRDYVPERTLATFPWLSNLTKKAFSRGRPLCVSYNRFFVFRNNCIASKNGSTFHSPPLTRLPERGVVLAKSPCKRVNPMTRSTQSCTAPSALCLLDEVAARVCGVGATAPWCRTGSSMIVWGDLSAVHSTTRVLPVMRCLARILA